MYGETFYGRHTAQHQLQWRQIKVSRYYEKVSRYYDKVSRLSDKISSCYEPMTFLAITSSRLYEKVSRSHLSF